MDLSPDGRYIVYDSRPEEGPRQLDIFLLAMDGSRDVPLIQHSADDYGPVWTPDGNQIVFVSDRMGNPALWVLQVVDGKPQGEPQLIQQDMNRMKPMGFTRDGAFYYAFSTSTGGNVNIATLDPATGKVLTPPEKIPQRFEGANGSPDWSPDGKYLAYVSMRDLGSKLVIRSVETGEERELPHKYASDIHWSPDGRSILVYDYNQTGGQLYLLNAQTGDATTILPGKPQIVLLGAAWSHDGKQIFYRRVHIGKTAYSWSVVARDLETGEEKELLSGDKYVPIAFAISPDGQQLAFSDTQVLQVMPSGGGEPREVLRLQPSETFAFATRPVWTPDGRHILFGKGKLYPDDPETEANQSFELWRIPVEGGEPQKLGLAIKGFRQLSVHPDGRQIAFTQPGARRSNEIWAMENFLPEIKTAK